MHRIDEVLLGDGGLRKEDIQPFPPQRAPNDRHSTSSANVISPGPVMAEPIAILGMGLRLPGGITTPEALWDLLLKGGDVRSRVPASRYNVDSFYSPSSKTGTVKSQHGYFLANDLQEFDTSFFSMNKTEVEMLDPQQRQLLEVVWECMERAGQTNWRGKNIGCYVGVYGEDWLDLMSKDTQDDGIYRISGAGDFLLANRISYEYDLKGPSMTTKTGCSSSLVCLHTACQALINGDCDSAIVGGTNLIMSPGMTVSMSQQGVLSPTGSCKTFDAAADGYARAEAINAIYIKKLSDAIRDGDPIRAVIRATASNCDGKTPGLAVPNSETQEAMIRHAYKAGGVPPSQTAFVECHGTGTPVGDPLEVQSVANVFGDDGVYIGSVKPNVGHSEGASGITSIIKCIMALEKSTIPPNIKFTNPNPKIPWKERKLQVPLQPVPWPQDRARRVSVNSFGVGGANAHVILEAPTTIPQPPPLPERKDNNHYHLLVFSANHADSLQTLIDNYQAYATRGKVTMADMAYTLATRRTHLPHRAFCLASGQTWKDVNRAAKSKHSRPVYFIFTGQGAQWAGMGKELTEQYASFREDIEQMDRVLEKLPHPPSWSIKKELLNPNPQQGQYMPPQLSQTLCTAVQIGLVNLLQRCCIYPAAVVGHSSGEMAAAYAAKAITAREALIAAYYRGRCASSAKVGAMAAVGLGRDQVTPFLVDGVCVACENSVENVTLSGDEIALDKAVASVKITYPDAFVRRLHVKVAYHSNHMAELGETYESLISPHIAAAAPQIPFYSSVTGRAVLKEGDLGSSYWRANMESPVLFDTALACSLHTDPAILLEIGPHSALSTPIRQTLKFTGKQATYLPTLKRGQNGQEAFLSTLGHLFLEGLLPDFRGLYSSSRNILVDMPVYPWNHDAKYWYESRISREWRLRPYPRHELLGSRILEGNELEPVWRNTLQLSNAPWLRDHRVHQDIVFPAAGYMAMAGEAVRQISGNQFTGYSIRRIHITTAMVLHETIKTEIMTSLRKVALTTSLDSDWYGFSIMSYNGGSWTKHCFGQARPDWEDSSFPGRVGDLPRAVPSPIWYQTMSSVGYNYGPNFQGLQAIKADTACQTSSAIVNDADHGDAFYELHPTTMDLCLQMISVALAQGIPRHLRQLVVPTEVDTIKVRRTNSPIHIQATAHTCPGSNGVVISNIHGVTDDGAESLPVLELNNVKLVPLLNNENGEFVDEDPHAGAQLHWAPDIDFLDSSILIEPLGSRTRDARLLCERLALLCILETRHKLALLPATKTVHLNKFQSWIDIEAMMSSQGKDSMIGDAQSLAQLESASRQRMITIVAEQIQTTKMAAVGTGIMQVYEAVGRVHQGQQEPLEVLTANNTLTHIYNLCHSLVDITPILDAIAHENPTLRVLEIGAGTGGTTAAVLDALKSRNGELRYSSYTFTDISSGFFVAAKERFKNERLMEYATLNIEKEPTEQGFQPGHYDLIVASNVFHATASLKNTLRNVHRLLHPRGRLLFIEVDPNVRFLSYIMGILPGWWLGEADGRKGTPYASVERWNEELLGAGFNGVEAFAYDDEPPHQIDAIILARPKNPLPAPKQLTLLIDQQTQAVQDVQDVCHSKGFRVDLCTMDDPIPAGQDIISLLDLDSPFFFHMSSDRMKKFQSLVGNLKDSGILWVTKPCQVGCDDAKYSLVLGVARTLRSELSVDLATLEMDHFMSANVETMLKVFTKFATRDRTGQIDYDFEYSLQDGVVRVGRFQKLSVSRALQQRKGAVYFTKKLFIGTFGTLQTLGWEEKAVDTLPDGHVRVATRAVGLNFRDVVGALGIVEIPHGFGFECAGIVEEVGPGVADVAPGDKVAVLDGGSFTSSLTTRAEFCVRLPEMMTFEEAATMPLVYGTAIYALMDLARLDSGMTVLIQSAAGGVGIAAIQIALHLGATVYATVGNEEKVQYLTRTFGIPRSNIFHSRDTSFVRDVKAATNGRGVDVVLNSLSGALLHASWECVAEFGKMIEIGKRDFMGQGKLDMGVFAANRSFFGVDLWTLTQKRPSLGHSLLKRTINMWQAGVVKPIFPLKVFNATEIGDSFRYMQKGLHMGKIVVRMPSDSEALPSSPTSQKLQLRPDRTYMLVGGLGGIGRAVATWMIECGAKHLILMSRSAASSIHAGFIHELETMGCEVQAVSCSVTDLDSIKAGIEKARVPISGVIQMSTIFQDQTYLQMSHEEWEISLGPKVDGTLNLHEALQGRSLDFFIMFSSISGIIGQIGQSNYAAGNTFLDAFCQFRRRRGLPASVIDIGALGDIGYASQNSVVLHKLKASGFYLLREQELLDSVQLAILQSSAPYDTASEAGFCSSTQFVIGLRSTLSWTDTKNQVR